MKDNLVKQVHIFHRFTIIVIYKEKHIYFEFFMFTTEDGTIKKIKIFFRFSKLFVI